MKTTLFDVEGKKKGDVDLPAIFTTTIREDLAYKYYYADLFRNMTPYSTYSEAGKRHSASGTISHKRHEWKGHYGKGISRAPRKTMWRRGTQFYWVGAESSSSRGGRSARPPKGNYAFRYVNKKEVQAAMNSAFAATANKNYIMKRYTNLPVISINPAVIESLPSKTKDVVSSLSAIFGAAFSHVFKNKTVRAGKGKSRGRKYKSNAGLLVVTGTGENVKCSGLDVKQVKEIKISDLYPLGRLTLYTKKAVEELGARK